MIKAFIIVAQTMDGFIAKNKDQISTSWSSQEDKKRFVTLTKRAGVVVMGSNTYETFKKPLKERLNIIYSRSKNYEGTETTSDEPVELLKKLEERGYKEVAICGGSEIYTKFINSGVVETIYMTIEPIIFGDGIKMFKGTLLNDIPLELVSSEITPTGTIFCEYKVIK